MSVTVNDQTNNYVLASADADGYVRVSTLGTPLFVGVPTNASIILAIGTRTEVRVAGGVGEITLVEAPGVTFNLNGLNSSARTINNSTLSRTMVLTKVKTDTWDIEGGELVGSIPGVPNIENSANLPNGFEGSVFTASLLASGGVQPYSFSASGLPPFLTLGSANGIMSGTPDDTEVSTWNFSVKVRDSFVFPQRASQVMVLIVDPMAGLSITTASNLPGGIEDEAYSQALAAAGGTGDLTWSATNLPAWLTLDASSGALTGTPVIADVSTWQFTGSVVDSSAVPVTATKPFTLIVASATTAVRTFSVALTASTGAEIATGLPTSIGSGGGATVTGGYLNLIGNDKFLDYEASSNVPTNTGAIRWVMKPNYNGAAPSGQIILPFDIYVNPSSDLTNRIAIFQRPGLAQWVLWTGDSNGNVPINDFVFGVQGMTAGQDFEFEYNWRNNTASSIHSLFIDGIKLGETALGEFQYTRTAALNTLRIGNGFQGTFDPEMEIRNFQIFDSIQHTANYTPAF